MLKRTSTIMINEKELKLIILKHLIDLEQAKSINAENISIFKSDDEYSVRIEYQEDLS